MLIPLERVKFAGVLKKAELMEVSVNNKDFELGMESLEKAVER